MPIEIFGGNNERAKDQKKTLHGRALYDEEPDLTESQETGVPTEDASTFDPDKLSTTIKQGKNLKKPPEITTNPDADELLRKAGFDKYGNQL